MLQRLRNTLPALIAFTLFIAALEVLRRELHAVSWRELSGDIVATPPARLALAVALTACNYAVLTLNDFIAFAYIGKLLPKARVALASFIAYAVSNNVGFAMLSGASVRYRFYTRWGITAEELSRLVFSYVVTFWLGLLLLGGASLAVSGLPRALELPAHALLAPAGWVCALASLAYVAATFVRRAPIRFGPFELPLPGPRLALAQLGISALDWALAGAVVYVLLPPSSLSFFVFVGAFVAAQLLGLVSHVPGGLGVFEGLMVLLLKPFIPSGALLPALVVYRAVYYLVPLAVASTILVADELHQRRDQAVRVGTLMGRITARLTPKVLALFAFASGLILLLSGATPAAAGRLALLNRVFPLGVIEASHFLGSIVGAALLVLSQGLARRLDAAYVLSIAAIVIGIAASLAKGADYEEAAVLTLVLFALWRARRAFDRHAAFFETRFSAGWVFAVVGGLGASIWLGMFAYKHVEYGTQLWWQFELHSEASRFLRASVGAAVFLLLFAFARLIGHAPHEVEPPSEAALDRVADIIATQTATSPFLVFLRDKAVLFDEANRGFVMYGVHGRSWVALGDPVGPPEIVGDLIRLFLERCDDFGGTAAFYEVSKDHLHRYADFGFTFVKLGEEARVDLQRFTLEGGSAAKFRQVLRRLDKAGVTFRIIPARQADAVMSQLQAVSDDWLHHKAGAEKGFSLGFFDPDYLSRFPIGVIEREGQIIAFANLWPGPQHVELSVDLMRYHHDAPVDVMEGLFVNLMKWGRSEAYQWFSLGMAPLAGFEQSPVAPLWLRLGSFLYQYGEVFYNFKGLRAYKNKFHPEWEPRYLVYPGGFKLPRILADISALIAGGYRGIVLKQRTVDRRPVVIQPAWRRPLAERPDSPRERQT